nr:hypothetical protein [Clostridioides sp.]
MNDEQILEILADNAELFKINELFSQVFRYLGWILIESLSIVSRELESINNKIYSMLDFFNSKGIAELLDKFKPIIWVILFVSIIYLSFQFIVNRKFQKDGLYANIVMAVMVVMLLPSLMVQVNKMTQNAMQAVNGEYSSTADKIVKENLTDLYYLDKNNFSVGDVKNGIPESKIRKINVNESIDSAQTENKEVFKNKIQSDENGDEKLVKLSKFLMLEEKYFRYSFNFFTIIISIGCTVVAQVFVAIKIARVSFDLAFTKLFAMIYAFGDIASGQRLKNIIQNILSSFAIIVSASFLLKIYTLFSGYVSSNSDGNLAIQLIYLIAGAWAVIDGPDIIERVLGIDSGVKSSSGVITSSYAGAKITGGVINAGKSVVTGGAGAMSSLSSLMSNRNSQQNAENQSDINSEKSNSGFGDNSQNDNSNNGIALTESNDIDSDKDDVISSIDDNLDSFNNDSDINSTDGVDLDKLKQDLNNKEDLDSTSIKDTNDINDDNSNPKNNDLDFGNNNFNDQPLDNIDNGNNANINNMQDPGIDLTPSSPINDKVTEDFKDDALDLNSDRLKNESIEFGLDSSGTQDINYNQNDKESTNVDKSNLNSQVKDDSKLTSSIGHMKSSNNDFNKIYNQESRTDISNKNTDEKNM